MRCSSPDSIIPRRNWSSHTLVPAAVRAASRSFTAVVLMLLDPFPGGARRTRKNGLDWTLANRHLFRRSPPAPPRKRRLGREGRSRRRRVWCLGVAPQHLGTTLRSLERSTQLARGSRRADPPSSPAQPFRACP